MASETYCGACGDYAPVILGRCASCWGSRPLETALADMALLARELEEARSRQRRPITRGGATGMAGKSSDAEVRVVRLQKFDQVWSCVECGTLAMRYGGSDLPPCPCGGEREYTGDVALTMIVTMDDLRSMVERHSDDCGGEPPNGGGDDE